MSGDCASSMLEDEEDWRLTGSMPSDDKGVELTRLSSGVRLDAERKMASADLRSDLPETVSASALAAVEEEVTKVCVSGRSKSGENSKGA